ncbi:Arm DNA-binding domain-containing protein [Tunturibacter empetritectus]|uniref:Integrase DNA-binding domain-containing protein n=2 Tax=Tunturiibacter TaxID=3154218 RepID=A0A852VFV0_9BACT|nr:Arm DNA-binding domain-containing protein [Edaphobacter lichenicola]NYF88326.1 hypothetical protein [Edaphobacter lichenicola]
MTFGRYPEVSLALARKRNEEARTLLADGLDPMAERKAKKIADQVAGETPSPVLRIGGWSIGSRGRVLAI